MNPRRDIMVEPSSGARGLTVGRASGKVNELRRAIEPKRARAMIQHFLAILLLLAAGTASAAERPNIVVILCDDMGFSDLGCYGGEIPTPNLDALAADGLRFTQFYNTARCCPTRACLLTGLYPHQAGVGHMMEDSGEQFPAIAAT